VAAAAVLFVLAGAVVSWKGWPGVAVGTPAGAVLVVAPTAGDDGAKPLVVAAAPVAHTVALTSGPQVAHSAVQPVSTLGGHSGVVSVTKTSTQPITNIKPSTGPTRVKPTAPTAPTSTTNGSLGSAVDGVGSLLGSTVSQTTGALGQITGGLSPTLGNVVTQLGQTLSNVLTGTTSLLGSLLGGGHAGHLGL
jgi:hypothetical protein